MEGLFVISLLFSAFSPGGNSTGHDKNNDQGSRHNHNYQIRCQIVRIIRPHGKAVLVLERSESDVLLESES